MPPASALSPPCRNVLSDESGTPSTTYAYAVRLETATCRVVHVITAKTGLPAPTNVVATPLETTSGSSGGQFRGDVLPDVFRNRSRDGFLVVRVRLCADGSTPSRSSPRKGFGNVWAVDANGISGIPSTAVPGRSLPQTLFPRRRAGGQVTYAWNFPIDADLVVIERSSDLSANSFVEVTRTAGTTFVDEAAPRGRRCCTASRRWTRWPDSARPRSTSLPSSPRRRT